VVKHKDKIDEETIWGYLYEVEDPELPISIVDMGIVNHVEFVPDERADGCTKVKVNITPTFTGCPAWREIQRRVTEAIFSNKLVTEVKVELNYGNPWTPEKISPKGKAKLNEFGIAMFKLMRGEGIIQCPHCHGTNVSKDNEFGPTLCKMIYYCNTCREPFEVLKNLKM
jgi:ring-1,2-phenylacetyl-CoA epoxidase subunit PaaD